MKTTYSHEELMDYLNCPFRYKLYHIDGVRRPIARRTILTQIYMVSFMAAINENLSKEQHMDMVMSMLDEHLVDFGYQLPYLKETADIIVTIFHRFTKLEFPRGPYTFGIPISYDMDGITITSKIPIVAGTVAIGFEIGIARTYQPDPHGMHHPLVLLCGGYSEYNSLEIQLTRTSRPVKYVKGPRTFMKKIYRRVMGDVIRSIRCGAFHRINPDLPMCAHTRCEYRKLCRGGKK